MKQHYIATCTALSVAVLGLLVAPAQAQTKPKPGSTGKAPAAAKAGTTGLASSIDTSVPACDDFYQHATGTWLKNNPIPPAEAAWGTANLLRDRNQVVLRRILDKAAADRTAKPGTNARKVGDYYASAMDTAAIEAAGLKYLTPHLNRIEQVRDLAGMQQLLADPKANRGSAWYELGVDQDLKKNELYAVYIGQSGLSLPDRDYYLTDDARSKGIRTAYQHYLVNTFKLLGDADAAAQQNAATVQRLETRLAKASRTRVQLRDIPALYNKMTLAQLAKDYPNLKFAPALQQRGLGAAQEIIVTQPEFAKEVNTMLTEEPLADQKTYLRWHLVRAATPALPKAYVDEAFKMSQVLSGAKKQQPRWKRTLLATDDALGEAFGQLYVAEAFSPEAKARAKALVENLRVAYAERIKATEWMSAATKAEALKKLNAFAVKIGYPDKWKDYSTLKIERASYLNNVFAAQEWAEQVNNRKYGQPVDRTEWTMTPPTVNAYYSPLKNEIVFPAGILQAPYFDPTADDAVNYGAIGAVIGHEMTHGFDDLGRQFDAQGNLRDWWTKEDGEKFAAKAAVVGQQFDAFTPLDSVHVNGKLTMGENLADLGGLTIAYQAFQRTQQAKDQKKIEGFTPEQRFFLSWAQAWHSNTRSEDLQQRLVTDNHSPNQYRVIGPLQNMPEFQAAFHCKEGDKMVRPAAVRAKIW